MSNYWTNFIATGDPNGKGLQKWPALREAPEETMELGDKMGPRPIIAREKLEALKRMREDTIH
jgi:carboxylesterase type B